MKIFKKIKFVFAQTSLLILSFSYLSAETLENYENIFSLKDLYRKGENAVLASSFETKKMALFILNEKGELEKTQEKTIIDHVWRAATYSSVNKNSIAVAFGYGRDNLDAPMSVKLFDQNLGGEQEIFNSRSERTETTHLEQVGDKLLIGFFDSKYFVKTGFLKNSSGVWEFVELFKKRLGIHLALGNKSIAIGRPYGDEIGIDGDVLLYENDSFTTLPSLRGVRSIAFAQVDADPELELVIGDGWHQNYGELAEPRLSMIDYTNGKHELKNVFLAKGEFAIEKIQALIFGKRTLILAAGEKSLWLFDPEKNWISKEIYKASNSKSFMDFAVLKNTEDGVVIAILDGNLLVKEIKL